MTCGVAALYIDARKLRTFNREEWNTLTEKQRREPIIELSKHVRRVRKQDNIMVTADELRNLRDYRLVLRLWERPSFAPSASWVLIEHQTSGQMLVRHLDWTTPQDEFELFVFADPHPETHLVVIPRDEIEPILRSLNETPVPLTGIERFIGLDGCKYGIERLDYYARVLLEWWEEGPKEWRAFTRTVTQLRKLLRQYAPNDDSAR